MEKDETRLAEGAGATTQSTTTHGTTTTANDRPAFSSLSSSGSSNEAAVTRPAGGATFTGQDRTTATTSYSGSSSNSYSDESRDLVVLDRSRKPSTTTVVGAAVLGAVAGAAIPFMLAGRSSSSRTSTTSKEAHVDESIVINRPSRELYDFWRNFENLPQFMNNIKSVDTLDQKRSHWVIKAPAGTSVEFDSRVVDDIPGRMISWQSEEDATVPNRGRVEFIETAAGNATNVRVTLSYEPPAGTAGRLVAALFQREPSVQAREDLQRLKELMENRSGS